MKVISVLVYKKHFIDKIGLAEPIGLVILLGHRSIVFSNPGY